MPLRMSPCYSDTRMVHGPDPVGEVILWARSRWSQHVESVTRSDPMLQPSPTHQIQPQSKPVYQLSPVCQIHLWPYPMCQNYLACKALSSGPQGSPQCRGAIAALITMAPETTGINVATISHSPNFQPCREPISWMTVPCAPDLAHGLKVEHYWTKT